MTKKSKINNTIIQICADNIRAGMTYTAAAHAINITYQTWNNWVNLGREGKAPYSKWYVAIQEAESDLLRECLTAVQASMRTGNVKSAEFLLQTRFASLGYGKQSSVRMESENTNLNVNTEISSMSTEQVRADILRRLAPRSERFKDRCDNE